MHFYIHNLSNRKQLCKSEGTEQFPKLQTGDQITRLIYAFHQLHARNESRSMVKLFWCEPTGVWAFALVFRLSSRPIPRDPLGVLHSEAKYARISSIWEPLFRLDRRYPLISHQRQVFREFDVDVCVSQVVGTLSKSHLNKLFVFEMENWLFGTHSFGRTN